MIIGCLSRFWKTDKFTLGILDIYEHDSAPLSPLFTVELPWRNNERNVSCIPAGVYDCIRRDSGVFEVTCVTERDGILFHTANTTRDIKGCIGIGTGIDPKTGYVFNSSDGMVEFNRRLRSITGFELRIM